MKIVDLWRQETHVEEDKKYALAKRFKHRLLIINDYHIFYIYITFTASRYPGIFMVHLMYLFILAASFQQGHPLKGNSFVLVFFGGR